MSDNQVNPTEDFDQAVQAVSEALDSNQGRVSKAELIRGLDLNPDTHARVRSHFGLENC